ncbi:MAG: hypothetical protein MUE71_06270 [Chitinophagaceae bacterium]|nr:hypothetical protein [Chitinophagaceae bacterium]
MKRTLLTVLLTGSIAGLWAQSSNKHIGGYGMASAELTFVEKEAAINIGAYGGILLNHKWLIGVSGNNIQFKRTIQDQKVNFQFNYYGLYSEYRFFHANPVSVTLGTTAALGWLTNEVNQEKGQSKKDGDYTYVIQPQLGLNVKITRFMQARLHGGYRFTGNTNSTHYSGKNLNAINAGAGLVFGSF